MSDMELRGMLSRLRAEIVLGSLFVSDYENTLGFTAESVCSFFDGYLEFLFEIAGESKTNPSWEDAYKLDNIDRIIEWYMCFDSEPLKQSNEMGD